MKRYIAILLLALVCLPVLAGCGCKHETWLEADCLTPKTCAECGETEGEAMGHSWAEADCENPKTCQSCGETEGEALGHDWAEANCENPRTCNTCGKTEGEALGHTWMDATTEAPQTCEVCAATEGERIITDERFTTAACQPLFGSWKGQTTLTTEEIGLTGVEGEIVFDVVLTFGNDGTATQVSTYADWESTRLLLKEYVRLSMYAQLAAQGMDQAAADAAIKNMYGMTMEQFAEAYVDSIDLDVMNEPAVMVYYTDGGTLFMAYDWNDEMTASMYSIEGDVLTQILLPGLEMVQFTRVTE